MVKVMQQVVGPASMSRCDVMLPRQEAEPPLLRRAQVES